MENYLEEIKKIKKELIFLRLKKSSGEDIKHNDIKDKKKQVARMFTVLNKRKK
jgi:ribosomal protein L29